MSAQDVFDDDDDYHFMTFCNLGVFRIKLDSKIYVRVFVICVKSFGGYRLV